MVVVVVDVAYNQHYFFPASLVIIYTLHEFLHDFKRKECSELLKLLQGHRFFPLPLSLSLPLSLPLTLAYSLSLHKLNENAGS